MADATETTIKAPKFAGITILSGLSKTNYFFMFFNTFLIGMFLSVTAVLQPAFMKDIIKIDQVFAGTIISFLPKHEPDRHPAFCRIDRRFVR